MAEKNLNIDNLKKVAAQHKGDTTVAAVRMGEPQDTAQTVGSFCAKTVRLLTRESS